VDVTRQGGVLYPVLRRLIELLDLEVPPLDAAPAEDAEALKAHLMRLSVTGAKVDAFSTALLALLMWPTDLMVFSPGSPALQAITVWRAVLIATGAAIGVLLLSTPRVARHPVLAANVGFAAVMAASGWLVGRLGGIENPLFYGVYTAPLLSVLVVAPLRAQVATTLNIVLSFLAAFFVTRPEALAHPYVGVPLVWLSSSVATAVLVGQIVRALLRANFLQRRTLERRADELAALDRAKNDFFANVNHELRTPLTNVVGALRTVARVSGEAERRTAIEAGLRSSERLLAMLGDLLTLSRLDGGRATTVKRLVDVAAVVRGVATEFQTDVAERVRLEVPPGGAVPAWIDARQVRTVLYNLLSNALKFSRPDDGPVEVALEATPSDVVLRVRDHGIGIEADQLPRIFDRFYQVEGGLSKRYGGVGIGLALVREIVERHEGGVTVASNPGQGTTFEVRLPRGDVRAVASADIAGYDPGEAEPGARGANPRALFGAHGTALPPEATPEGPPGAPLVLVAEDDPDLRDYLVSLLRARYRVLSTADGAAAFEAARAHVPHLVLTDVMMPRLSGTELLAALRADAALRHVPVVLLTAVVGARARVLSLREGANDYVAKPFDDDELLARLDSQLRLSQLTRDLDAQVAAQTREIRHLADNLVAIQEGERTRIAREIHDELGQVLAALRLTLDHTRRLLAKGEIDPPRLDGALIESGHLLDRVHEAVSDVLNELRPGRLESQGLSAAVEVLGRELCHRRGLRWQFTSELADDGVPDEHAVALFRIAQEALTNVARHARATAVSVSLDESDGAARLLVVDDGVGFAADAPAPSGHFGLLGMRERARLLHGTVDIESRPGAGTRLDVKLPLAPR
jgi:signal transduction histidine kinase